MWVVLPWCLPVALLKRSYLVCIPYSRSGRSKAAAAKEDSEEEDEEEEEEQEDEPTPKVHKGISDFREFWVIRLNSTEKLISTVSSSDSSPLFFFSLPQGRKKAAGRRRWAKKKKRWPRTKEDTVYSEVVEEWRRKENMDTELFKLFIRRRSLLLHKLTLLHTPHAHRISTPVSSAVVSCIVLHCDDVRHIR